MVVELLVFKSIYSIYEDKGLFLFYTSILFLMLRLLSCDHI